MYKVLHNKIYLLKIALSLSCLLLFGTVGFAQKYSCLPPDIKEDAVVSFEASKSSKSGAMKPITVGQTLKKLKAGCRRGKLIDGKHKPIVFYNLQGCWGNPPADYLEIMERQKQEIARLKKKNTVIEMTCNTSGRPQSISKVIY